MMKGILVLALLSGLAKMTDRAPSDIGGLPFLGGGGLDIGTGGGLMKSSFGKGGLKSSAGGDGNSGGGGDTSSVALRKKLMGWVDPG